MPEGRSLRPLKGRVRGDQIAPGRVDESRVGWQDGVEPTLNRFSRIPLRGTLTPQPATIHVLVVDDEASIREIVADALRESGYGVQTARNGAEAFEVLHRWLPHAIVLDLMMPRVDGSGFLDLLRLDPRFASLPVLVVTAAYSAHEAARRTGVRAVLTKPFELDQLVETVRQLAGAPPPTLEPTPAPVDLTAQLAPPMAHTSHDLLGST